MKTKWFRHYWYWIVIAVIVVTAGALISVFSSYWLCKYILKFFEDWSVALSAAAAVILAIAAFRSITENRRMREAERKERLLNEIIEWAVDVANWRSESKKIFKEMAGITDSKQQEVFTHAHILEMKEGFAGRGGRNQYIINISNKFKKVLHEVVEKLITDLEVYIEFLDDWQRVKANEIAHNLDSEYEYYTKADELLLKVDESKNSVIEEATKIKTRDIEQKEGNMSQEDKATGNNEPTLKDIEERLKQQGIQMKKGNYLTGAAFGAAIALVGISLMVQISLQLSPYVYIWFFIAAGLGFMFWCWWKQGKVK